MPLQSRILLFNLAFLAFLCSNSMAFSNAMMRNTIMNAHATSSGILDLKTDSSNNFYVEADLSYYWGSKNSSNSTASDTAKMMISLTNTDTMVSTNCLNFSYYNCSSHSCNQLSYTKTIDFPTFTANASYAQGSIYLDYNYWSLSSSNYLHIAYSCSGSSSVGSGRYGVLGLGTGDGAANNFGSSVSFSIFVNSDLKGGKLLFKKDANTYTQSSKALATFSANTTWQITTSRSYFLVGSSSVGFSGNIMFDVNSNAIGLPSDIFDSFVSDFKSLPDIHCYNGYTYRPYCFTTKEFKDLPNIILSIESQQIKIPPQVYATLNSDSGTFKYFYLNFKEISPSLSGENYVSPSFARSVILDANFMSFYYTIFDASTGLNIIYLYPSINAPSAGLAKWIAIGAAGAFLLVSICCCAKKKRVTVTTTTAAPLNNTPTVYNQPTDGPIYSYDANQFNYQPQALYQPYNPEPQGYNPPANFQ